MPTLNDLRDALTAREVHAGDPVVVQRYLNQRLDGRPPHRRHLAPAATAAIVAIAGGIGAVGDDQLLTVTGPTPRSQKEIGPSR